MRRTGVRVSAFRNSIIHWIFSEFLQPFRYVRTQRFAPFWIVVFVFIWFWTFGWLGQRVAPFFSFYMWTWHRCWMGNYPTQVFPCSSLTVAWHSCGWWSRRALGRRGMINFLPWRCHGCWRRKVGGRTRWQARNHDRNEVLRVALYSNTVFNEMWFLTVDPLVRISVFIAQLSER